MNYSTIGAHGSQIKVINSNITGDVGLADEWTPFGDLVKGVVEGDESGLMEVNAQAYRRLTPSGKSSIKFIGCVQHKGLNLEKKLIAVDLLTLKVRLTDQAKKWVKEWDILKREERAENVLGELKNILVDGVSEEVFDWEKAKNLKLFLKEKPIFNEHKPKLEETQPIPNFFDRFISNLLSGSGVLTEQKQNYEDALNLWEEKKKFHENEMKAWEKEKKEFEKRQQEHNRNVAAAKKEYEKSKPQAVEWYSQMLLEQSVYPIDFKKKVAIEYKLSEKLLVVEYFFPSTEDFPKIKETKYLKSSGETKEVLFSDREFSSLYEDVLYQITLRSIYELFEADTAGAIESVIFNGWVNHLNKAIGKRQDICTLSIMVNKDEFLEVNFAEVDAKACFKRFKGVSASELSSLTPIPPILKISREDRRFVEGYTVGQNLDDSVNVAAMDWQDFEHFIREIFEREYSPFGGEVKVTQSSRDKGVDAVIFDPDPIRGGKIIIQAKRYTNTVHIESVRALYGVMQDEGAMKGILITTSDFGSDAYSFAKDKPIALLNGGNLLSMIHKHGYKGKIDIDEAKKILDE